jgi:hypothetical protein
MKKYSVCAYIFTHDQNIIEEYEKTDKFSKTFGNDYKYVFVGTGDIYKIENKPNVIVARNQVDNIEQFKKLVTFTGWYALAKNNLFDAEYEYSLLIEYDVILSVKFNEIVTNILKSSKQCDIFSFISVPKDFLFYEYTHQIMSQEETSAFKVKREQYISTGGKSEWMGSSNSLWRTDLVPKFVEWFEIFKDQFSADGIGHTVERALTIFCISRGIQYQFIGNVLSHLYLDSHETQAKFNKGVQKNYKDHILKLATEFNLDNNR